MSAVISRGQQLWLNLYIQPKASRDKILGIHGDELKVAITAPPIDGQANTHLQKFIAKQFKVTPSNVVIAKGALGRHKLVCITEPKQLPEVVIRCLSGDMD